MDTKAYKCYDCSKKIRDSAKDNTMRPPWDIALTQKEIHVFPEPGNPRKLRFTKEPESVYYHPQPTTFFVMEAMADPEQKRPGS